MTNMMLFSCVRLTLLYRAFPSKYRRYNPVPIPIIMVAVPRKRNAFPPKIRFAVRALNI